VTGIVTVKGGVVLAAPGDVMLWDWDHWEDATIDQKVDMLQSLFLGIPALGEGDKALAMKAIEQCAEQVIALYACQNRGG
jgi:hypothetical protein